MISGKFSLFVNFTNIRTPILITIIFIYSWNQCKCQGGIMGPQGYSMEFSVKNCFDSSAYRKVQIPKTIRPNYIFKGQRIWRSVSLENTNNRQILNSGGKCAQLGLFEIIKFGLLEKKLHAFNTDDPVGKNAQALKETEVVNLLRYSYSDTVTVFDANGEEKKEINAGRNYLLGKDIKSYLLKEDWVMNSHTGKQEKYIIAIAPLIYDPKTERVAPLFWLYYPEWEGFFACFEAKNYYSQEKISFKEILNYKYFISKIDKSSNIFDRDFKTEHRGENNIQKDEGLKEQLNTNESDLFPH